MPNLSLARSSSRIRLTGAAVLIGLAVSLALASTACASVFVDTGGVDSGSCGATPVTACATIQQAVTNAAATDTIEIGPGTFHTGTANGIIVAGKSLTFHGAGQGVTVVSGDDATTYGQAGTFRFNTAATAQTLSDLSVANFGRTGTSRRDAVFLPAPGVGIGLTITNVEFVGPNDGTFNSSGLEVNGTSQPIVVDGLTSTGIEGNVLLLQNASNTVLVQNSTFNAPLNTGNYAITDAMFGATAGPTTGPHQYLNNSFNARAGITIQSGFFGSAQGQPFAQPVVVDGNSFDALTAGLLGVEVANTSNNPNTGAGAGFSSVSVTNNILQGSGATTGIQLTGLLTNVTVSNNDVRDFSFGVRLRRSTANNSPPASAAPTGVDVTLNQIVGNVVGMFVDSDGNATGSATNNWWGCNAGPGGGGCDTVLQAASGVNYDPWAVLTIAAAKSTLGESESGGVTAGITTNSDGAAIGNLLPDGTDISFGGTNGTVLPNTGTTDSSAATTTFTSSSSTGRTVSAQYDNQLVSYAWPDFEPPPQPPPPAPIDPLPACAANVAITNVAVRGSRSLVSGIARLKFAGQRVSIQYRATGRRVVARPTVRADGSFSVTVRRPSRPGVGSNLARYRAILGNTATRWIKLTRRLVTSSIRYADGRVTVDGRVITPIARRATMVVTRADACGRYARVGSFSYSRRTGRFSRSVEVTRPAAPTAVFVRLNTRVRSSGHSRKEFTTFSIVAPLVLTP
ncbi:MAG: hypothetical protein ACRDKI_02305 [Solirubrobacterales bacterium]